MTRFQELKQFITEKMSMSHIYQPLMLIELLKNMEGKASVKEIAQSILNKDPTQIEYFSQVVKNMVGKVLTKNHEIATKAVHHWKDEHVSYLSAVDDDRDVKEWWSQGISQRHCSSYSQ